MLNKNINVAPWGVGLVLHISVQGTPVDTIRLAINNNPDKTQGGLKEASKCDIVLLKQSTWINRHSTAKC